MKLQTPKAKERGVEDSRVLRIKYIYKKKLISFNFYNDL